MSNFGDTKIPKTKLHWENPDLTEFECDDAMLLLKLAWRNTWRNRRRSLLTALSVVITLVFIVFLESLNKGVFDYLIENEINIYSAHLEVFHADYVQQRNVQQALRNADSITAYAFGIPAVADVRKRLEMLVLVSGGESSQPAVLWGIEPDKEPMLSGVAFDTTSPVSENSISIGRDMAGFLGVQAGDSVVLIGQSYYGRIAAMHVHVQKLFDIPIRDISQHFIIAPLRLVEEFADLEGGATSLHITLDDKNHASNVSKHLSEIYDEEGLEINSWIETLSGRLSTYELRMAAVNVLKIILFVVMAFGILSTIILTNNERRQEFGMLMGIGMKRRFLLAVFMMEMLVISIMGVLVAFAVVFPIIAVIYHNPIPLQGEMVTIFSHFNVDPVIVVSRDPYSFLKNAGIGLMLAMMLSLLTSVMIIRLKVAEAINH